ncbi:CheW protein [Ferrimonas sediminum]|uniref:CheW protein n=1 Tax=Ferrimonas sediminum TaxID=718193 RepID=A0A1G8YY24_9GAMM|nr:chemotaxis protein CheW [Ferrimonas sediminum]SDK07647.1 CheW protein [Ferrimonas sediminum]
MSKAAEQALLDYFDVMLTPPKPELDEVQKASLSQLLARAQGDGMTVAEAVPEPSTEVEEAIEVQQQPSSVKVESEPVIDTQTAVSVKTQVEHTTAKDEAGWRDELEQEFQCLYFEVAGLVIAVPLLTLGGIKRLSKLNHLPGSPNWVLGVQLDAQDGKLNVVDSGQWFLADRPQTNTADYDYQYLVRLGDSPWTLACESLLDAEPLSKSEINWQQQASSKRPWLAGIVRDKKCVVLDVPELIRMLDAGLDITVKES